uniref:Transcription factor BTF3 n=1 Tax=Ditylenchus dipsaci TaxID=166011 RepID=A0A915DM95_9BILA
MEATDEKIKKLQQNAESVRNRWKGVQFSNIPGVSLKLSIVQALLAAREVVHKTAATDDKKLQTHLKISVTTIPSIDEVNMICDDGSVIHFNVPRCRLLSRRILSRYITGLLKETVGRDVPHILTQLGIGSLNQLQKLVENQIVRRSQMMEFQVDLVGDIDLRKWLSRMVKCSSSSTKPSKDQSLMDAVD